MIHSCQNAASIWCRINASSVAGCHRAAHGGMMCSTGAFLVRAGTVHVMTSSSISPGRPPEVIPVLAAAGLLDSRARVCSHPRRPPFGLLWQSG
ncbi:hypothetical protein D3C81_777190 [compost metagenome]